MLDVSNKLKWCLYSLGNFQEYIHHTYSLDKANIKSHNIDNHYMYINIDMNKDLHFILYFNYFQKKLDVCTFQVNSTDFCPSNETEWNKRSSKMNCSETNAYMCVPNERFSQLVEFCYDRRAILIFKGKDKPRTHNY